MEPMKFEYGDREWSYDPSKITVAQAIVIKDWTGHGLRSWSVDIDDWDPKSVQALFWMVKQQNGDIGTIGDVECDIPKFMAAFSVASTEQAIKVLVADIEDADPEQAARLIETISQRDPRLAATLRDRLAAVDPPMAEDDASSTDVPTPTSAA